VILYSFSLKKEGTKEQVLQNTDHIAFYMFLFALKTRNKQGTFGVKKEQDTSIHASKHTRSYSAVPFLT